jgi:hypothetical protein
MSDFKTPLQKKLDAKHKKNTIASNRNINKSWGDGFIIKSSTVTDMDIIEAERYSRIQNYKNSIGAK